MAVEDTVYVGGAVDEMDYSVAQPRAVNRLFFLYRNVKGINNATRILLFQLRVNMRRPYGKL